MSRADSPCPDSGLGIRLRSLFETDPINSLLFSMFHNPKPITLNTKPSNPMMPWLLPMSELNSHERGCDRLNEKIK